MVIGSPLKFVADLRGKGSYTFNYSPNTTSIRLSINHQLVYEGPPIEQFAGRGIVVVEPESTGDEVWVEMRDRCSPDSILRGVFLNAIDALKSKKN
jgi:hypothetical protein